MASAKLNIVLDEGSAWSKRIVWTDANNNAINLTNYWIRSAIKKTYQSTSNEMLATTDETGAGTSIITTTAANGIIDVLFSATDIAAAIAGGFRSGVWDMEVVPPAAVATYGTNYTNATLTIFNSTQLKITSNHIDSAFDTVWFPADATKNKLIVRGSTIDGGVCDGYYKVILCTATEMTCAAHLNTGFVGGAATNAELVLIRPDVNYAQKIIGGGVSVTEEVTTSEAHPFE